MQKRLTELICSDVWNHDSWKCDQGGKNGFGTRLFSWSSVDLVDCWLCRIVLSRRGVDACMGKEFIRIQELVLSIPRSSTIGNEQTSSWDIVIDSFQPVATALTVKASFKATLSGSRWCWSNTNPLSIVPLVALTFDVWGRYELPGSLEVAADG